jgi:hypothetical protein
MMGGNSTDNTIYMFGIISANLLPLIGAIFFNWESNNLLFVYWIQNILFIIFYSGLVAFATQEPILNDRNHTPRAVSIPFISNRSGWAQLVEWLPPINYWNIQYITWPLLFGLSFWLISGTKIIDLSNPSPLTEGLNTPFRDYITVLTTAGSLEATLIAFLIFGMLFALICRDFFGQEQYKSFSAPSLAEIPIRIGLYWFITVFFIQFILILTHPFLYPFDQTAHTGLRVILIVLVMKILSEWSLIKIQQGNNPNKIVYWFSLFWQGPEIPEDDN